MPDSKEQVKVNEQLRITQDLLKNIAEGYNKIEINTKPILDQGNRLVTAAQEEFEQKVKNAGQDKAKLKSLGYTGARLTEVEEAYQHMTDNIDGIVDGSVEVKDLTGLIANLNHNNAGFLADAAINAQKMQETLADPKTGKVFDAIDKGAGKLEGMISSMPGGSFFSDQFNIGGGIKEAAGQMKGNFLKSVSKGGSGFKGMLKGVKLLKVGMIGVALAVAAFAMEANKVQKDLGLSYAQSAQILGQAKAITAANKLNGMTQEETLQIMKGIASEFGSFSDATTAATLQASNLVANFGLGADSVGILARQMQAVGSSSLESALSSIELQANMARAADVPVAEVMNDVAKNTDFFAKFAKAGGANITEAAIAARKLGLEMSNVASIADSLLNFEDSIQKQMEAEVLLGKELNLEKAREMIFNNDIAGAMGEISKLVSPEEFEAMDAIRRQALAAAVGLDAGAMAKAISGGAAGGGITSAMRTGGAPAGGGGKDKMDMLITTVQEGNHNMVRAVQNQGVA
jgi:hypothetical protein